jgi:hypothetical protein
VIPIAPASPHTDAVVAAIAPVMLVDRGRKPSGGGWTSNPGTSTFIRYAIVYPSPGQPDGNEAEPLEYLDYSAQISIFGASHSQVEAGRDAVSAALIGRRLVVAGRSTYRVQSPGGPPITRDDSVQPSLFMGVVEIAFRSQPA